MNVSGPPQSRMGGTMSYPLASVMMVCTVTARNIEAAMSSRAAFLAIRFWMSVLQNTPQREAMGYTFWARRARSFSVSTDTSSSTAI